MSVATHSIAENDIRLRSYLIWEREGRMPGKEIEHWLRAKAELEWEALAHRRACERSQKPKADAA